MKRVDHFCPNSASRAGRSGLICPDHSCFSFVTLEKKPVRKKVINKEKGLQWQLCRACAILDDDNTRVRCKGSFTIDISYSRHLLAVLTSVPPDRRQFATFEDLMCLSVATLYVTNTLNFANDFVNQPVKPLYKNSGILFVQSSEKQGKRKFCCFDFKLHFTYVRREKMSNGP